jgi:hypothetical protein
MAVRSPSRQPGLQTRDRTGRGLLRRTPALALGFALLLQGCAGLLQGKEERAWDGNVQVRKGRPGIVIGAPLGTVEENTGVIAADLATLTGFGLVVMRGSVPVGSSRQSPRVCAAGRSARLDREPGAEAAYRQRVAEAAQGPLRLYVEVQGEGPDGGGRVEISTAGLSRDDAWRLGTLFELVRDSRLDQPSVPRFEVRVDSADGAPSSGPSTRQSAATRALCIDLPEAARTTYRDVYTGVLGAFLSESATVLMVRDR